MILSDDEIISAIKSVISDTSFSLEFFSRNHGAFGNIIVVISNGHEKYKFGTDRGEIYCNQKFLLDGSYHVAGEDDTPLYLITEIDTLVHSK